MDRRTCCRVTSTRSALVALVLLCSCWLCHGQQASTPKEYAVEHVLQPEERALVRVPAMLSSILAQPQEQAFPSTQQTTASGTFTISAAAAAATATPSAMDPKFQYLFDQQNKHRSAHGSLPLVWDDSLAADAGAFAQQCIFGHNMDELQSKLQGENIGASTGVTEDVALQTAVEWWYAESANYDWDHPGNAKPNTTGYIEHFTQMVWKGTTKVGCASIFCPVLGVFSQAWYIVCRYYIIGNWDGNNGQFWAENVLPLGSSPGQVSPSPDPQNPNPQNPDTPIPNLPVFSSPGPLNPGDNDNSTGPPSPLGLVLPQGPLLDNMAEGVFMQAPACIASPNDMYRFCLLLEDKPQLVLINGSSVSWRKLMPASSKAPYHIYLYPDGWAPNANLLVKDGAGKVLWKVPKKAGQKSPYRLVIGNNGRLVLTGAGKISWSKRA